MYQVILVLHVIICLCLIALVLLQHGKGADMGAGFGAGASGTVFGAKGASSFLFKVTGFFAVMFFATSIYLSYMVTRDANKPAEPVFNFETPVTQTAPAPAQPAEKTADVDAPVIPESE